MVSTVNAERSRLQNVYAPLRIKILNYYQLLPLVGREAGAEAHQLPRKLGQWHETHSARVHAACPELIDVIDAIEALAAQRSPNYIKRLHIRQRPGPKPKMYRDTTPPAYSEHSLLGEYRGGYKL